MSSNQMHTKHLSILLAGAVGLFWGITPAHAQNSITNGDFETGPFAPSSTVTGWNVGGTGHMHSIAQGATSPSHSAAFSIGHDSEGTTLSQTIATVPGELYTLDFDAGVFGQRTADPLQLNVQVQGGGTLINATVTPPDAFTFNAAAVTFNHYHYVFIANTASTTVQFTDIGLGNTTADIVVDSVAVVHNVVTNSTFEAPPFSSNGTVSGWVVGGTNNVASLAEGATTPSHSAAFSPGGDTEGTTLSQEHCDDERHHLLRRI